MKFILIALLVGALPSIKDMTLDLELEEGAYTLPPITVIVLSNKPGVPEGWMDSTTREDATAICNDLIATQSKLYANAISRSRCIMQVQE
jgi:hypothetical protein